MVAWTHDRDQEPPHHPPIAGLDKRTLEARFASLLSRVTAVQTEIKQKSEESDHSIEELEAENRDQILHIEALEEIICKQKTLTAAMRRKEASSEIEFRDAKEENAQAGLNSKALWFSFLADGRLHNELVEERLSQFTKAVKINELKEGKEALFKEVRDANAILERTKLNPLPQWFSNCLDEGIVKAKKQEIHPSPPSSTVLTEIERLLVVWDDWTIAGVADSPIVLLIHKKIAAKLLKAPPYQHHTKVSEIIDLQMKALSFPEAYTPVLSHDHISASHAANTILEVNDGRNDLKNTVDLKAIRTIRELRDEVAGLQQALSDAHDTDEKVYDENFRSRAEKLMEELAEAEEDRAAPARDNDRLVKASAEESLADSNDGKIAMSNEIYELGTKNDRFGQELNDTSDCLEEAEDNRVMLSRNVEKLVSEKASLEKELAAAEDILRQIGSFSSSIRPMATESTSQEAKANADADTDTASCSTGILTPPDTA
ncbi:MAG: hypothetical protein Q9161_004675 [Pseudevernia consocians]